MILISKDKNSIIKMDKGELISYKKNGEELIHQKTNPGWRNSDTEMFPIIGPTNANNFIVTTPKGNYNQDQHGLLRELEYTLLDQNDTSFVFQKKYTAYTAIENSKYPNKSTVRLVSWPYNFSFQKKIELQNNGLKISFEISAEKGMPFMLGYHPAFMLKGNLDEIIEFKNQSITIPKIIEGGSKAYSILNTNKLKLIKKEGYNLSIETKGFNNFMLWTEVSNMLCIEPITAYPYVGEKMLSEKLFNKSNGIDTFEVLITPYK
ncbi:aldose 1-epimerase [Lutibacter sp. A80]|uniref:aldose epimerase family protein n=1 Tax=Lutibacter sp. A80 TaxID=2918453 RepID=UPI001F05C952|nr:aldose 1-epimerase [Lutibacter sp. A80]UMB60935.1 aldose 1-epimerase [Lutibacter sp. A80]